MRFHSQNPDKSGQGWRPLLVVLVFAAFPLLVACGNSGSGNKGAAAKAPAKSDSSGSESGGMSSGMSGNGGMMSNHMGNGAGSTDSGSSDTSQQASGSSTKNTQVADNSSGSGSSGSAQQEQKRPPMDGETVYSRFCVMCHRTGMNGAPKYGNKQAWAPRIAQGKQTLYHAAIHGLRGMPPKGGISGLYDQEVKDAVNYMVQAAGGWKDNSSN